MAGETPEVIDVEWRDVGADLDFSKKKRSRKRKRGQRKKDYPKFTPDVRLKILNARATGHSPKDCAAISGIAIPTLERWLKKGEDALIKIDGGEQTFQIDQDFAAFYVTFHHYQVSVKTILLSTITKSIAGATYTGPDGAEIPTLAAGRLAMEFLAKYDPEEFGTINTKLKVEGGIDHRHQIEMSENRAKLAEYPTEELRVLREVTIKVEESDLEEKKQLDANTKKE